MECLAIALLFIVIMETQGNSCPPPSKVFCTPRCKDSSDCWSNEVCCDNICNDKSCVPKILKGFILDDNKNCHGVICGPHEMCIHDEHSRMWKCLDETRYIVTTKGTTTEYIVPKIGVMCNDELCSPPNVCILVDKQRRKRKCVPELQTLSLTPMEQEYSSTQKIHKDCSEVVCEPFEVCAFDKLRSKFKCVSEVRVTPVRHSTISKIIKTSKVCGGILCRFPNVCIFDRPKKKYICRPEITTIPMPDDADDNTPKPAKVCGDTTCNPPEVCQFDKLKNKHKCMLLLRGVMFKKTPRPGRFVKPDRK